jgi:hypothetical protein
MPWLCSLESEIVTEGWERGHLARILEGPAGSAGILPAVRRLPACRVGLFGVRRLDGALDRAPLGARASCPRYAGFQHAAPAFLECAGLTALWICRWVKRRSNCK